MNILKKNKEHLIQKSLFPSRGFEQRYPEYKAEVPLTSTNMPKLFNLGSAILNLDALLTPKYEVFKKKQFFNVSGIENREYGLRDSSR
jgi:hypothetical protein